MKNKFMLLGALFIMATTILLAQLTNSGYWPPGHVMQSPPYDRKTPPALTMSDAYSLALSNPGTETNSYYPVSASCLTPLPLASKAGFNHGIQGWTFQFSNTNGAIKRIGVYFDKTVIDIDRDQPTGF